MADKFPESLPGFQGALGENRTSMDPRMAGILLLFVAACASATVPSPDASPDATAQATCHRLPEHDASCPSGTVAMSCLTSEKCTWDPGAEPRVCCP